MSKNPKTDQAIALFNAMRMDRPIAFGQDELVQGLPETCYVPNIHGDGGGDPVQELADQISWMEGSGAYLFTGNRGTGKTTELLRLASVLRAEGCEVFYVDMTEYLNLTVSLDVSSFIISVMGAFSEKIKARFNDRSPGDRGYFERLRDYFTTTEVKLEEITLPVADADLKLSLREDPRFKALLENGTRDHLAQLVKQAREFASEAAAFIRHERHDDALKIVLIVDSVERLRGVGSTQEINEVFKSAETVFSSHADKLRFSGLSIVYTVPPYLSALAGGLGALYSGSRVYMLPSVHIYDGCPVDGADPKPSALGLDAMFNIFEKRYSDWNAIFGDRSPLDRLALASGGDIRDFFRMIQQVALKWPSAAAVDDKMLEHAEGAIRNDMQLIAADDMARLALVAQTHQHGLGTLDELPVFARLLQGKYLLNYRNGEDWYDIHPVLRERVMAFVREQSQR